MIDNLQNSMEKEVDNKNYRGWEKLEHETQMRVKAFFIEQGIYYSPAIAILSLFFTYGLIIDSTLPYGESYKYINGWFWFWLTIAILLNLISLIYFKPLFQKVMKKSNQEIQEDVYRKGAKFTTSQGFNISIEQHQKDEFDITKDKNVFDSFKIPIQQLSIETDKRFEIDPVEKIQIPFTSMATGLMIMGSPGRGKSVLLNIMIDQIPNDENTKTVIIDVKGEFVEKFYNPNKDYILCPSDLRSVRFQLHKLIKTRIDAGAIAEILISDDKQSQDPHWISTARAVMEGVLLYASKHELSNKKIFELISEPAKIAEIKEDEEVLLIVGNFLRINDAGVPDKETASVLSSLARKAKTLQYLKYLDELKNNELIEFNKWLFNGNGGKLFLLATENLSKVFSPLYGVITSYIISTVLDTEDSKTRSIYLILDELPRLGKALGENLEKALAVGRSKGLKIAMAMQSYSQIKKEFGEKEAETILDTTNSYVVFQSNVGAQFLEKYFGKTTVLRNNESFSFSANSMGDRVTLSRQEVKENIIDDAEINRLAKFEFYAKIEGCLDILKSRLKASFIDGNGMTKYVENPAMTIQKIDFHSKIIIQRINNRYIDTLNVFERAKKCAKTVVFEF